MDVIEAVLFVCIAALIIVGVLSMSDSDFLIMAISSLLVLAIVLITWALSIM